MNPQTQAHRDAFVLRIAHGHGDMVQEALQANQIIIGWAYAEGLLDPDLSWWDFRGIVSAAYHSEETTYSKAGRAAGQMWKFIRDMKAGDLVVVPYGSNFFVAEIAGAPTYDPTKVEADSAYRRPVRWMNEGKPIPRSIARSALISRMKTYGTCAAATDLVGEIEECVNLATRGETPTFQNDLQSRLIGAVLDELRSGRMESYGFENLIKTVLEGMGGEARIIPRNQDMGADLIATFRIAGAFSQTIAVQAKHWRPEPPVGKHVVDQLIGGIAAESANLGMVVTSGTISEEARQAAKQYFDDKGIRIELVDGEQFSKLIVEHGIRVS
jgi:predicted Mrr-cat superfamily restriction endonuclease